MRKFSSITLGILVCILASDAAAQLAPSDAHLTIVPRTKAELARIETILRPTSDFSKAERFEANPAGAATVRAMSTPDVFSQPSGNIAFERELDFKIGNGLFKKLWVSSPSSTLASDGLGPLYNARSCQRCHIKDGRGHPPAGPKDSTVSMIARIAVPGGDSALQIEGYLATVPDPVYGSQVQDLTVAGHPAEGQLRMTYTEETVALSGGETAALRRPSYRIEQLGYGDMHPKAALSPRVAPQMIGLGLLEAIPAKDILALADPDDTNGDGISGRVQVVMSTVHDVPMLGRFGLKAGKPSVLEQTAGAFHGDIGISTTLFPQGFGDCTAAQEACRSAPDGNTPAHGDVEIGDEGLQLVTYYSSNLGVPARRNVDDPQVLHGKRIFYETGCIACHTPKFVTHRLENQPEQSFQLIWPYSDMLLHDMGPGLADGFPEARATGREWRTPPLWGIGLTETVSGHTYFLHDGRARNLLEAVLWHGGEAKKQKQAVIDMPPEDRAALIHFLESL